MTNKPDHAQRQEMNSAVQGDKFDEAFQSALVAASLKIGVLHRTEEQDWAKDIARQTVVAMLGEAADICEYWHSSANAWTAVEIRKLMEQVQGEGNANQA